MNICFVSREFIGSKRAGGIATNVYDMSKVLITQGRRVFVICAIPLYNKIYKIFILIKLKVTSNFCRVI